MTNDPALRGLAKALDPDYMLRVIGRARGVGPEELPHYHCAPEVITHKRGQRCVVRYELSRREDAECSCSVQTVFGKLYDTRRRAMRMYEQARGLRDRGLPSLPDCLRLVRPLRLVLHEGVDGVALGTLLGSGAEFEAIAMAARWLALLHATPPLPGLKKLPPARVLEKLESWCAETASALPSEQATLASLTALIAHAPDVASTYEPAMIHKDYHPGHVLWNGRSGWVVDFDELSLGDPALDLGHFLAQLDYEAYLRTGRADAYAAQAEAFCRVYLETADIDPRPRLAFYRAYTFAKLAHGKTIKRRPGWQEHARMLVARAHGALQPSPARS